MGKAAQASPDLEGNKEERRSRFSLRPDDQPSRNQQERQPSGVNDQQLRQLYFRNHWPLHALQPRMRAEGWRIGEHE